MTPRLVGMESLGRWATRGGAEAIIRVVAVSLALATAAGAVSAQAQGRGRAGSSNFTATTVQSPNAALAQAPLPSGPSPARTACDGATTRLAATPQTQSVVPVVPIQGEPTVAQEIVREVRVHGNYRTPDADVLRLAGVAIGQVLEPGAVEAIAERLRKSGRFDAVELRKRLRSIDDPTDVALIISVRERPGVDALGKMPGPLSRLGSRLMYLPVAEYADLYGFTYGVRVTLVDPIGKESRVSVPLTWGGWKRAAVEVDKSFSRGPLSRIVVGVSVNRHENAFYREDDTRNVARIEASKSWWNRVRLSGTVAWNDVSFGTTRGHLLTGGAALALDTRGNASFPRNAVFTTVGWDALRLDARTSVGRYHADLRGYLGLVGSSVLVVRGLFEGADGPLPPYEKALLGGYENLRGFRAGTSAGDNLVAGSVELRMPTTSPMRVGQSGFRLFVDAGASFDHGQRLARRDIERSVGTGWFLRVPLVRCDIDLAYGLRHGVRVNVAAALAF